MKTVVIISYLLSEEFLVVYFLVANRKLGTKNILPKSRRITYTYRNSVGYNIFLRRQWATSEMGYPKVGIDK